MARTWLLVLSSILLAAALASCAGEAVPEEDDAEPTPARTAAPARTPSTAEPGPTQTPDDASPTRTPRTTTRATPEPAAEGTRFATGSNARVEDLQISIIESDPVQVNALVSGFVPDGCTEIDQHGVQREGSTFVITLTTRRPVDAMCTMALEPFTRTVPLDVEGLEPGEYTVRAGGETARFELEADGTARSDDQPAAPGAGVRTGLATVRTVEVVAGAGSLSPEIAIRGYLSDACTDLGDMHDRLSPQDPNTVLVTVESTRVQEALCAQVVKAFDVTYTVTSISGPGEYVIDVNGVTVEYTAR